MAVVFEGLVLTGATIGDDGRRWFVGAVVLGVAIAGGLAWWGRRRPGGPGRRTGIGLDGLDATDLGEEVGPGPGHTGAHGADRAVERDRRLLVAEAHHLGEHEGLPTVVVEGVEEVVDGDVAPGSRRRSATVAGDASAGAVARVGGRGRRTRCARW